MKRISIVKEENTPRKSLRPTSAEHEQKLAIQNIIGGSQDSEEVYLTEQFYDDEDENIEALEEEVDIFKEEDEEVASGSGEPDLRTELASLVKKTNVSNAFTDNLLKLLRKNGHTDLPTDKTALVSKPKPKPLPVKMIDENILIKVLDIQMAIMKDQKLIMSQLKALTKSQALQRGRLGVLCENVEKCLPFSMAPISVPPPDQEIIRLNNIFPIKTVEEFEEFNQNLEDDGFRATVFPEIVKIFMNANWLCMIIDDEVTHEYNLNGIRNKKSLKDTRLCRLLEMHFKDNEYIQDYHLQGLIRNAHGRTNTKNSRERIKLRKSGHLKPENDYNLNDSDPIA